LAKRAVEVRETGKRQTSSRSKTAATSRFSSKRVTFREGGQQDRTLMVSLLLPP